MWMHWTRLPPHPPPPPPKLDYLETDLENNVLRIYPEKRDWFCNRDVDHVNYHKDCIDKFEKQEFSVHSTCNNIPVWALATRLSFFRLICTEVRQNYKNQIKEIVIKNAPWYVRGFANIMRSSNLIADATYKKIAFE